MVVSTLSNFPALAANTTDTTTSVSTATGLAKYYATNPTGYGKAASIKIDGKFDDWSKDMLIAQGVANDDARTFRGTHEGPVYDTYALYGSWDDNNLYLMWQFTNVTDVIDPAQGYPISDNGKPYNGDIPQIIALSIDPNKGGSGQIKNTNAKTGVTTIDDNIWGIKVNYKTKVDKLLYFSSKPGVGQPALFSADDKGLFSYSTAKGFKDAGITYKYGDGCLSDTVMGIKANGYEGYTPQDLYSDSSKFNWVDMKSVGHKTSQDTMYEMAIPLSSLGINRAYIEKNGIGAMHISTFGESGIASIPFDKSMLDNATEAYGPDSSTSAEKADNDVITTDLARIGKASDGTVIAPPTPPVVDPTKPDDPTPVDPTKPVNPGDEYTITLNPDSGKTTDSTNDGPAAKAKDGTILHAWNWSFDTIKNNMDAIKDAGYTSVQTSPIQGTKENSMAMSKWWVLYQPINFKIGNAQLGTRKQFADMCQVAHQKGIKVIVDAVTNHTANAGGGSLQDYPDSTVDPEIKNNPNYWHEAKEINDWNNRWQVTHWCMGVPDLNTSNEGLQNIIINFLNDCIACGADGFRFDAAKDIELPNDPSGSNYWPRVLGSLNNKNNLFIYGEVLQGDADNYDSYPQYMNVSASKYGSHLRRAVGYNSGSNNVYEAQSYDASRASASDLVTFVETHDTYAGTIGDLSTGLTDWQIVRAWALAASRAQSTPLFFDRPAGASSTNVLPGNMGGVGSTTWKDPDVVAVNKFHNAMVGQGENLRYQGSKVELIERGTKGMTIVNLGSATTINSETKLEDGTYTNKASGGGTFTVSNGRITGNIGDGQIVVLYKSTPGPINGPRVSIKESDRTFNTDSFNITLQAQDAKYATYAIDGGKSYIYTDGQQINIGKDKPFESEIKVELRAINDSGDTTSETYTFTKREKGENSVVYFRKPSGWGTPNVYIYDESTSPVTEVAAWPGVAMKDEGNGLYSYELIKDMKNPKVIFNSGSNQIPQAKQPGFDLSGKMIYDNGVWKKYDGDNPQPPTPTNETKVYLQNFSGWGTPNVYIYQDSSGSVKEVAKWPGVAMKDEGSGLFSYTLPSEWQTAKVIFNSGSKQFPAGNQAGLDLKGTMIYKDNQWSDYNNQPQPQPSIKRIAYFRKPSGWGTPKAYIYEENGGAVNKLAEWPGVDMKDEGNGLYSYELTGSWSNPLIIFTDGKNQTPGSGQKGFELSGSKIYQNNQWTDYSNQPQPETKNIAYFQKPSWWGSPKVYIYEENGSSVKTLAAWPGVNMKDEGNGLYSYELTGSWSNPLVIFTDGKNQTPGSGQKGFELSGSKIYKDNQWMDYSK